MKKISTLYRCTWRSFTNRQLLRPPNNLEKKHPSEKERTYNIRKLQTRFYWVFSWELMERATILPPFSTGSSSILLSVRTQYSWRTRLWKNINNISMEGGLRKQWIWIQQYPSKCAWYLLIICTCSLILCEIHQQVIVIAIYAINFAFSILRVNKGAL